MTESSSTSVCWMSSVLMKPMVGRHRRSTCFCDTRLTKQMEFIDNVMCGEENKSFLIPVAIGFVHSQCYYCFSISLLCTVPIAYVHTDPFVLFQSSALHLTKSYPCLPVLPPSYLPPIYITSAAPTTVAPPPPPNALV